MNFRSKEGKRGSERGEEARSLASQALGRLVEQVPLELSAVTVGECRVRPGRFPKAPADSATHTHAGTPVHAYCERGFQW